MCFLDICPVFISEGECQENISTYDHTITHASTGKRTHRRAHPPCRSPNCSELRGLEIDCRRVPVPPVFTFKYSVYLQVVFHAEQKGPFICVPENGLPSKMTPHLRGCIILAVLINLTSLPTAHFFRLLIPRLPVERRNGSVKQSIRGVGYSFIFTFTLSPSRSSYGRPFRRFPPGKGNSLGKGKKRKKSVNRTTPSRRGSAE